MKKMTSLCMLVLFPLAAQAGYVFEMTAPLKENIKIDKESITFVVKDDTAGTGGYLKTVRHEDVNEKTLQQLSSVYNAKVSIINNYEGGRKLNNDDLVVITANKGIAITSDISIESSGSISMLTNNDAATTTEKKQEL